jgi:hypothetical protein
MLTRFAVDVPVIALTDPLWRHGAFRAAGFTLRCCWSRAFRTRWQQPFAGHSHTR